MLLGVPDHTLGSFGSPSEHMFIFVFFIFSCVPDGAKGAVFSGRKPTPKRSVFHAHFISIIRIHIPASSVSIAGTNFVRASS